MPAADMLKKKMFSIPFLLQEDGNSDEYHNLRISKICTSAMLDLLGKKPLVVRLQESCREKHSSLPCFEGPDFKQQAKMEHSFRRRSQNQL
jgi:hypothetical protein